MPNRQVFYSFHYQNDVFRAQLIRNIGALDDNKPVAPNEWEEVKRKGDDAIKKWIDDNMNYRSCVVVLVGENTAQRPWVKYEIKKAWEEGRGLIGVHVHHIQCPQNGHSIKGDNPFDLFKLPSGARLSKVVRCYDPSSVDAYGEIRKNMESWVEKA
ncbi:MAG: hypothetical protein RLZZ326_1965, partial [Planctomycetota bacterium]